MTRDHVQVQYNTWYIHLAYDDIQAVDTRRHAGALTQTREGTGDERMLEDRSFHAKEEQQEWPLASSS